MKSENVKKAVNALEEFLARVAFLKQEVKELDYDAELYQIKADSCRYDAAYCRQELNMCKEIAERIKRSLDDIYLHDVWEERIV